jgi:plastocyanin
MSKTSRRKLLKGTAVAGIAAALGVTIKPETLAAQADSQKHQHSTINGPLANATVSFGAWPAPPQPPPEPPPAELDRFAGIGAPDLPNVHQLIPNEVKIKAGGSVNFIISGFHNVIVYDDGTQPGDIDKTLLIDGLLINDPDRRIYRGLDPRLPAIELQERTEVVHFPKPGTYLVICGVLPHFNDGMFGFVKVLS